MLRSWMFVPGDSEKMLGKSTSLAADALVFDLEDAVNEPRKAVAREMVAAHLQQAPRDGSQLWVRINALDTAHALSDIKTVLAGRPDGLVLPKAEHGQLADTLAGHLDAAETDLGLQAGSTRIALIAFETPRAVLNLASYQTLHPRVCGLSWGAEDLAAGIGAQSNRDEQGEYTEPYRLARSLSLIAAGAAAVQAIDTAFTDFRDLAGLQRSCQQARRDGFLGKIAIHPGQLEAIHAAFTPGEDELEHARAVVAAFAANPGAGVVALDGKMLDKPHLQQAERLLSFEASAP